MKYAVVIPAFNEALFIRETIDSLNKQSVGRNNFEVIVVDNSSTDNTSEIAKSAGAEKVIIEKRHGTNFARETGYKNSSGDIVAFLDADSEPKENWLQKIGELLADPEVYAVSGPFDYGYGGIKKFLADTYNGTLPVVPLWLKAIFGRKAGVIIGGNFAVRKGTMERVGGFPPLSFWGDDAAIAMLISRRAGKVLFDKSIAVYSSPRRLQKEGFFRLSLKYMRAYLKMYFAKEYR